MTPEQRAEALRLALVHAWQLGQTYWQQADSESYKQNALSNVTLDKFNAHLEETLRTLAAEPQGEPVAWIQRDHLQKARVAPFLCRVEPTKRMPDFVPLYLHPPKEPT